MLQYIKTADLWIIEHSSASSQMWDKLLLLIKVVLTAQTSAVDIAQFFV